MKKKEIIMTVGILLAAVLIWLILQAAGGQNKGRIRIIAGGEVLGTYSLSEDQVIEIGKTNRCEIKNGSVRMIYADCPDQLCMLQTPVDASGGSIICLPNQVIIETAPGSSDAQSPEVDAVS